MKFTLSLLLAAATTVMAAPHPQALPNPADDPEGTIANVFFTFTEASGNQNQAFAFPISSGAAVLVEVPAEDSPRALSGIILEFVDRFDGGDPEGIACSVFCDGNNATGQEVGVIDLANPFLDLAVCGTVSGLVCG